MCRLLIKSKIGFTSIQSSCFEQSWKQNIIEIFNCWVWVYQIKMGVFGQYWIQITLGRPFLFCIYVICYVITSEKRWSWLSFAETESDFLSRPNKLWLKSILSEMEFGLGIISQKHPNKMRILNELEKKTNLASASIVFPVFRTLRIAAQL